LRKVENGKQDTKIGASMSIFSLASSLVHFVQKQQLKAHLATSFWLFFAFLD
jgi:hypothetical protein